MKSYIIKQVEREEEAAKVQEEGLFTRIPAIPRGDRYFIPNETYHEEHPGSYGWETQEDALEFFERYLKELELSGGRDKFRYFLVEVTWEDLREV